MKKWMTSLLALLVLVGTVGSLASCAAEDPPPPLEEVYDRLVTVIEASHEVNVWLFGAGLPVYPRGDAEDALVHRYYATDDNGLLYVTPYAKYRSIAEMQTAMAAVYSTAYRTSLFESLFTGYADSEVSAIMPARYQEDELALYQNRYVEALVEGVRVYDYAGMQILDGSSATYLRVSIPSYTEDAPGEWRDVTLSFVYENGDWYLDSPSC